MRFLIRTDSFPCGRGHDHASPVAPPGKCGSILCCISFLTHFSSRPSPSLYVLHVCSRRCTLHHRRERGLTCKSSAITHQRADTSNRQGAVSKETSTGNKLSRAGAGFAGDGELPVLWGGVEGMPGTCPFL